VELSIESGTWYRRDLGFTWLSAHQSNVASLDFTSCLFLMCSAYASLWVDYHRRFEHDYPMAVRDCVTWGCTRSAVISVSMSTTIQIYDDREESDNFATLYHYDKTLGSSYNTSHALDCLKWYYYNNEQVPCDFYVVQQLPSWASTLCNASSAAIPQHITLWQTWIDNSQQHFHLGSSDIIR